MDVRKCNHSLAIGITEKYIGHNVTFSFSSTTFVRNNFLSDKYLASYAVDVNRREHGSLYCNGFDQRVASQQLCKQGHIPRVRGDVTQRWVVVT
jgi:hypothetical protein